MHHRSRPLIVGIGGTTRPNSSTERALVVSLAAAAAEGAATLLISGPELVMPIYEPGEAQRAPQSRHLVEAFRRCHGIIIASPSYHGSLSGLIKNALDYTEDLSGDARSYFDGLPVGLISCAGGWQAAGQTLTTLRGIVHALRGWPTPLGVTLNTSTRLFADNGACLDAAVQHQLETVGRQVAAFAKAGFAACEPVPPALVPA